jgi:hypothetical protein
LAVIGWRPDVFLWRKHERREFANGAEGGECATFVADERSPIGLRARNLMQRKEEDHGQE